MHKCEYPGCTNPGQAHHIVFRSQGGMDIPVNFKYLCVEHHSSGKAAVHNNRKFDLELKRSMQEMLYKMLPKDKYTIEEAAKIILCSKKKLEKKLKTVKSVEGYYEKEDIIRKIMGDRLY